MKHLPFEHLDVNATVNHFTRLALSRLTTNVNFTVCRGTLEMHLTNLIRSYLKTQSSRTQQLPDTLQYLIMYTLGLLKLPFLAPQGPGGKALVTLDALDQMSYMRFALNQMGPEEVLPLLNPWIVNIHDFALSYE